MTPEEMAEGTAPVVDGGQGQAPDSGLRPDLSAVPEGAREKVLSAFTDMEANFNKRFEEAATFRKQWEPYQALGVTDVDPEEMADLIAFREIAGDPARFKEWYERVGQEFGLTSAEQEALEEESPDIESIIEARLAERLGPLEAQQRQQEEAGRLADAQSFIDSKLSALADKHGEFDQDAVCQLALVYEGEEAIDKAFADYQRLIGAAEQNVLGSKLKQPETPAQGGRPDSTPHAITDWGEARKAALERMQMAASL